MQAVVLRPLTSDREPLIRTSIRIPLNGGIADRSINYLRTSFDINGVCAVIYQMLRVRSIWNEGARGRAQAVCHAEVTSRHCDAQAVPARRLDAVKKKIKSTHPCRRQKIF